MVASWVVLGGPLLFVHRTRTGRAIRAVSMDRKGALISGIDPDRTNLVTWAVSGALGALAGVFFATYTQLHSGMWVAPLIIAVAVVIVGGIGSIVGSLVVAHVIGFMETAYTTGMLTYHLDTPLWLSIPAAVLVTMAGGTLFFLPALRIRGTYLALVTLAFMELMYQLTQVVAPKITGGTRGLSGIPTLVSGTVPNYYLTFAVMFAIGLGLWLLVRTRLGAALSAIRMDEEAVSASGFSTIRLKLFAFMVSAAVAGVGGALYVHYLGSVAPRGLFDINFLFTILVAALLGGASTIVGPIMGAYFLTFLLEYLRPFIPGPERYVIYGAVALVVYVLEPRGLYHMVGALGEAATRRLGALRMRGSAP